MIPFIEKPLFFAKEGFFIFYIPKSKDMFYFVMKANEIFPASKTVVEPGFKLLAKFGAECAKKSGGVEPNCDFLLRSLFLLHES